MRNVTRKYQAFAWYEELNEVFVAGPKHQDLLIVVVNVRNWSSAAFEIHLLQVLVTEYKERGPAAPDRVAAEHEESDFGESIRHIVIKRELDLGTLDLNRTWHR